MSWASRRRTTYLSGVILFFLIVIGGPILYWWVSSIPPACPIGNLRPSGMSNGPCSVLDTQYLQPVNVMWARSFKVRDGSYTAVAYVENANPNAGVQHAHYRIGLYDSGNVLIADREGEMFIMPGSITPVLETGIYTGNRTVVHTYFQITDTSPVWQEATSPAEKITITNQTSSNLDTAPRIDADAQNTSLDTMRNVSFVVVLFDPAGNAFAASGTALSQLDPDSPQPISFNWPEPFTASVGRVDIITLLPPALASVK